MDSSNSDQRLPIRQDRREGYEIDVARFLVEVIKRYGAHQIETLDETRDGLIHSRQEGVDHFVDNDR